MAAHRISLGAPSPGKSHGHSHELYTDTHEFPTNISQLLHYYHNIYYVSCLGQLCSGNRAGLQDLQ